MPKRAQRKREPQTTAQKQADVASAGSAASLKGEEFYRSLVNASPDAIVLIDPLGVIVFASPKAYQLLACEPGSRLEGTNMLEWLPAEEHSRAADSLSKILAGGAVDRAEFGLLRQDGTGTCAGVCGAAMWDAKGTIIGATLVIQDLTEQKARQAAHRATEERFSTIFRHSPVGIAFTRFEDGSIVDVNHALLRLTGYEREEMIGRTTVELGLWESANQRADVVRIVGREGRAADQMIRIRAKDGQVRDAVSSFELVDIGGEQFLLAMWVDLTERMRVKRELRASEERFREVVEVISEVFWVFDVASQRITYVSRNFERVWGRSPEELYASRTVWMDALHPADRARVLAAMPLDEPGSGYDETYRIIRPDGAVRWIRDRAFAVRDSEGHLKRVVGVADDITERKQLERQSLHAQRLEAIGTLASGIAHDINNILAPMLIIPRLLRKSVSSDGERELLTMLEDNAKRGGEIVRQLLTFSRGAESNRRPIQLDTLVKEMLSIMRETFPREIDIRGSIRKPLPTVDVDPTQIHQVLINLCVNARDAMPAGGFLSLEAHAAEIGAEAPGIHLDAKPGRYVVLEVSDTGKGIPPEMLNRIFDPFFTTKEMGRGTGLGLSNVRGIVKGYAGFVTVQSEMGKGSRFAVHLPEHATQRADAKIPAEDPALAGDGGLVLLVDDEEFIRTAFRELLEDHGYTVLLAADGAEALELYRRSREQIRVVVTDMMMPKMSGLTLIRHLRDLSPNLPIVATTGFDEAESQIELEHLRVPRALRKPSTPSEFLNALRPQMRPSRHP